jgi:hypothetical protein
VFHGFGVTCVATGYPIFMADRKVRALGLVVIAIGLLYLVLAVVGFAQISDNTTVGGDLKAGNPPELLWGVFGVSTVHNFIHAVLAGFTIVGGFTFAKSKLITWCVTIGYGMLFVYGVIAIMVREGVDPLSITWGDNILHLLTAVVLGMLAIVPERSRVTVQ